MAAKAPKSPWLHAWHDPVADLKTFSPCVRVCDLNGMHHMVRP